MTPTPTDEQLAILDLARGTDNLMLNALAGTGKTTTLEMIQSVLTTRPVLYLVFNKRNAEEAEKRFPSTTTIRTFNSLGHRIWAKTCVKNLTLNPRKTQDQLRDIISTVPRAQQGPIWDSYWSVVSGVAMAKSLGYIPDGVYPNANHLTSRTAFHAALEERPDELTADLIDAALKISIRTAYEGYIDYNDQIYMPALFGGTFPRFPVVKVDEYQDLNPCNHAMLDKLAKHRLIGVGDPWQSIYAFRGAKSAGMAEAQKAFSMTECDLSISFRCPQAIVEAARWRVPNFKWLKPGGRAVELKNPTYHGVKDGSAIICRNNSPLFKIAMQLLQSGRGVSVAGSDIGPKLVALLKRLGEGELSQGGVLSAIEDWRAERLAKGSTTANDLADCMKVFAGYGQTLSQAVTYAEHLFKQKGGIRLLTGHKAKGLEWDTVYHLDPWLLGDDEQDLNLRYVITTRSANELYEVNSRDFR